MTDYLPLKRMQERLARDREESDTAAFHALLYYGELVQKLTILGLLAALRETSDRQKYRLQYQAIREDSPGGWTGILDELVGGPASQQLSVAAYREQNELNFKADRSSWQHRAVSSMAAALDRLGLKTEGIGEKV